MNFGNMIKRSFSIYLALLMKNKHQFKRHKHDSFVKQFELSFIDTWISSNKLKDIPFIGMFEMRDIHKLEENRSNARYKFWLTDKMINKSEVAIIRLKKWNFKLKKSSN
jgi:hypothetical protein